MINANCCRKLRNSIKHTRSVITPVKEAPEGFETAGYGRIVRFDKPEPFGSIVRRVIKALGLSGISVAVPQSIPTSEKSDIEISSIGICAGSGGSMLNGLDVDLLFTGELSHHEALAAVERGKCVITTFHSNSERSFLTEVLSLQLTNAAVDEILQRTGSDRFEDEEINQMKFRVSDADRDPFEIAMGNDETW
jgi:putative NIF3 family GTP cyclohydrolase 1 type 2